MKVSREQHVEIRWHGDGATAEAALEVLGFPTGKPDQGGICERWTSVPVSKAAAVRAAIRAAGGELQEQKP